MIVIDAGRLLTAEVDGVPRLEAVIAAALHLAHAAVEHDDNVGLLVFADTIQRYVRAGAGPAGAARRAGGAGRGRRDGWWSPTTRRRSAIWRRRAGSARSRCSSPT